MTREQKQHLIAIVEEDLATERVEDFEPPAWHLEILRERMQRVAEGKAVWHTVDEVFDRIRARLR